MKKAIGRARSDVAKVMPVETASGGIDESILLSDLRTLVQSARQRIATVAQSTQTLLCWQLGRRLSNEHLTGGRAAYGRQILVTVSRELTTDYGRGFSYAEIAWMACWTSVITNPYWRCTRPCAGTIGTSTPPPPLTTFRPIGNFGIATKRQGQRDCRYRTLRRRQGLALAWSGSGPLARARNKKGRQAPG